MPKLACHLALSALLLWSFQAKAAQAPQEFKTPPPGVLEKPGEASAAQAPQELQAPPPGILDRPREAANSRQSYEEIEIYRRLLLKALRPHVYGTQNSGLAEGKNGVSQVYSYFDGTNWNDTWDGEGKNGVSQVHSYATTYSQPLGSNLNAAHMNYHAGSGYAPFSVEGVLLDPVGVVITAELPMKLPVPEKNVQTEAIRVTDWERTRRELHGEKVDKSENTPPRRVSYLDTVLHSLAENGHHFSGLAPTQGVTLVLTFRGGSMQQCQTCHGAASNYSGTYNPAFNYYDVRDLLFPSGQSSNSQANSAGKPHAMQNITAVPAGQPSQPTAVPDILTQSFPSYDGPNNRVLVGDLHFKQGRYEEALAAYNKTREEYARGLPPSNKNNPVHINREAILTLLELQNKIIQCNMALKQEERVEEGLRSLKRLMVQLEPVEPKADAAKPTDNASKTAKESALPTKVIITASKSLLDQVGNGKISFEEFKKKATVDIVSFEVPASTK